MNFAQKLKKELAAIANKKQEMLATLLAFLHLSATYDPQNQTTKFWLTSDYLTQYLVNLLKQINGNIHYEILSGNNKFFIKTKYPLNDYFFINDIFKQEHLFLNNINYQKAFLRGCFLARGSINDPANSNYHMEIQSPNKNAIILIQRILLLFSLNAKITKRRNNFLVYLKEAEKIADFIKIIGGNQALFTYEEFRINRDFQNSLTKVINCEIHNQTLATTVANKQLKQIALLEEYHAYLITEHKLEDIIALRKKYPEASLSELATYYQNEYRQKISRTSIYRKLDKINKLLKGL